MYRFIYKGIRVSLYHLYFTEVLPKINDYYYYEWFLATKDISHSSQNRKHSDIISQKNYYFQIVRQKTSTITSRYVTNFK